MQDNHNRIAYKRQKLIIIELSFEKISKIAKNSTAKPKKRMSSQTIVSIISTNLGPFGANLENHLVCL